MMGHFQKEEMLRMIRVFESYLNSEKSSILYLIFKGEPEKKSTNYKSDYCLIFNTSSFIQITPELTVVLYFLLKLTKKYFHIQHIFFYLICFIYKASVTV